MRRNVVKGGGTKLYSFNRSGEKQLSGNIILKRGRWRGHERSWVGTTGRPRTQETAAFGTSVGDLCRGGVGRYGVGQKQFSEGRQRKTEK